jgi:2-iminobutanoate/2-iminopropanoate deaminase
MDREVIATDKAAAAVGPYSQGVKSGGFTFTVGQIVLDPRTDKLIEGDITLQTRRAMDNIRRILEAGGSLLSHVLETAVFLANISDFGEFNTAYAEFFTKVPSPARLTVGVGEISLGALMEIEAIAIVPQ